jgi:hypothetical protein
MRSGKPLFTRLLALGSIHPCLENRLDLEVNARNPNASTSIVSPRTNSAPTCEDDPSGAKQRRPISESKLIWPYCPEPREDATAAPSEQPMGTLDAKIKTRSASQLETKLACNLNKTWKVKH